METNTFQERMEELQRNPQLKKFHKISPKIAIGVGVIWLLWSSYVLSFIPDHTPAQIMLFASFFWFATSWGLKRTYELLEAREKTYNFMLLFNQKMKGFNTFEDKMLVDFMWCLFHYDTGTRKLKLKWRSTARVAYNGTASLAAQRALKAINASILKNEELLPQNLTALETENFSLVIDRLVLDRK